MKQIYLVLIGIVGIGGIVYLAHKGYLGNKVQTYTTNITSKVVKSPVDSVQNTPTQGGNTNSIKSNVIPFFSSYLDNLQNGVIVQ